MSLRPNLPEREKGLSGAEIERLVHLLDSLVDGESAAAVLMTEPEAVPFLRRLLLHGSPRSVYVGRQRAVMVLSQLGAADVLVEYLFAPKQIDDAALRYSEEAVENTAARELGKVRTETAFQTLLKLIQRRPLSAAVEAVGEFRRPEAIPPLIHWLADDVARQGAEASLRLLAVESSPYLIEAVRSPEPSAGNESPGSLRRRQAALRLLAGASLNAQVWDRLRFLLYETDEVLAIRAATIALVLGDEEDANRATAILIRQLSSHDWSVVAESEQALRDSYPRTRKAICLEVTRNSQPQDLDGRKRVAILLSILSCQEIA